MMRKFAGKNPRREVLINTCMWLKFSTKSRERIKNLVQNCKLDTLSSSFVSTCFDHSQNSWANIFLTKKTFFCILDVNVETFLLTYNTLYKIDDSRIILVFSVWKNKLKISFSLLWHANAVAICSHSVASSFDTSYL